MSLLREIQDAAIDANTDISVLLRKCKVLAARLGNENFKSWVEYELNGYPNNTELPDYRKLKTASYGNFLGIGWSQNNNAPIPLNCIPKKYRDSIGNIYCAESISYYESLVKEHSGSDPLKVDWNADFLAYMADKILKGWTCIRAWQSLTVGSLVVILSTVKNRVLSFALELEAEAPDAGESMAAERQITEERVGQVFHQTIVMGNVQNLAVGNQAVTHTEITIIQNDLQSLIQYLASAGIAKQDLDELEASIHADGQSKDRDKLGGKVKAWLGKMISKAGSASWQIATSVAAQLLIEALKKYYGFAI
jgi:hypothetical protein